MKIAKKFFTTKIYMWIVFLLLAIMGAIFILGSFTNNQKESNQSYSMIKNIEKVNEVVFLNAGIQDVETQTNNIEIPWVKLGIPLTEKKAIIILNYNAKFGIKEPVKIREQEDKKYQITIPKYQVIGVELDEKIPYQLYDKSGDLLSYSTKDIDTGELVTQKLSNEAQEKYLNQYTDQLNQSAESYYKTLFKAIDEEIKLEIKFEK